MTIQNQEMQEEVAFLEKGDLIDRRHFLIIMEILDEISFIINDEFFKSYLQTKNRQTLFQFTFTLSILISSNFPHKYSLLMLSCISTVFGLRTDVSKFPILEKRRNLGRVNFRKDFWDCY